MNLQQSELSYLNRIYTQSEISSLTGIPSSTLSYVMRGERTLPEKYNTSTHSIYAQTAFDMLYDSGATKSAAYSMMNAHPDTVIEHEFRWQGVVERMTEYDIRSQLKKEGIDATFENILTRWDDIYEKKISILHKMQINLGQAENNTFESP